MKSAKASVVFLLVLLAVASSCGFCVSAADPALSKVAEAEKAVGQAFSAVLEAEHAGANVTGLLTRLNEAVGLLSQAEMADRNGDADTAVDKADAAVSIASGVQTAAVDSKSMALVAGQNSLLSSVAFSVTGAIAFVLVLFLVWRWAKRRYVKNLFDAKPEVTA